jgi:hypothetical protein
VNKSGSDQFTESDGDRLKPISLNPLDLETALAAAIATGPITDPALRSSRKKKRRED